MVEGRDGLIPTTEHDAIVEVVAKAFHGEGIRNRRGYRGVEEWWYNIRMSFCRTPKPVYAVECSLIETRVPICTTRCREMSGRDEARSRRTGKRKDVQERKAARKTKTKKAPKSFTIRGSWEGILGVPTVKGKRRSRESSKGWTGGPEKKNKRNGRYNIGTDGVSVLLLFVW
jgi:hypothetical protein